MPTLSSLINFFFVIFPKLLNFFFVCASIFIHFLHIIIHLLVQFIQHFRYCFIFILFSNCSPFLIDSFFLLPSSKILVLSFQFSISSRSSFLTPSVFPNYSNCFPSRTLFLLDPFSVIFKIALLCM